MARVFVAMSGGVDSSVTAGLLVAQGHDVTGVTMQLWQSGSDEGGCCSVGAVHDARRVCDLLGIPHYALNFREEFESCVVADFAAQYAAGRTPNPCVRCNDLLKFSTLLTKASLLGADFLATGHYARIVEHADRPWLARGLDPAKDQSYFLYRMTKTQLSRTLFPLGELSKTEVRELARSMNLSVAEKPESQDTCFAIGSDHLEVVRDRAPQAFAPGDIVTRAGDIIGHHGGIANFTVGQRKGLGVGGTGHPLYVVSLDAETRRVIVGERSDLSVSEVSTADFVWSGEPEQSVRAAVRYRMQPVPAQAVRDGDSLRVAFASPVEGVAPGQSVVCYEDDRVIGGGIIE